MRAFAARLVGGTGRTTKNGMLGETAADVKRKPIHPAAEEQRHYIAECRSAYRFGERSISAVLTAVAVCVDRRRSERRSASRVRFAIIKPLPE